MARRRRDRSGDNAETIVRLILGILIFTAFEIGGVTGFSAAFRSLVTVVLIAFAALTGVAIAYIIWLMFRRPSGKPSPTTAHGWQSLNSQPLAPEHRTGAIAQRAAFEPAAWEASTIRAALDEIDWYQFEKFCAALLQADGFNVTRKGGAQPDGGVDLIVEKSGIHALVQCKHWRRWSVQEKTVREMLGAVTHFSVKQGAIYTLKGWTQSAARFAAEHDITLVNGQELAASAATQLSSEQLNTLLRPGVHHCPKCESAMVERTSAFGSFWGCSTYPRCRAKLKHAGAR